MKTIPRPQPEMAKGDPAQRAGYEGLGSLAGGALLVAILDGSLIQMPVDIMHGAFKDFLIPGIILFWLCVMNVVAFFSVLQRKKTDRIWAVLATGGMAICCSFSTRTQPCIYLFRRS